VPGKRIVLLAAKLGSIDTGSPIYYQGVLAGEVLGYELGTDRKSVFIHAFVKSPYDELVQSNTRFWNVSGVDVEVGTEGIKVRSESLQTIIFGGITFDTPITLERVKKDVEGLVFTLYDNFESIQEKSFVKKIIFILFFKESIRGLNVGAPVEFKGIKVGSVVDVRLEFDKRDSSFRIPVLIEIEPQRIIEREIIEVSSPYETLKNLVDHGLRARLQTGSILTGQLLVELGMHPDTPIHLANEAGPYPELPTIPPANFEQITNSMKNILAKVEKVDLDKIGMELLEAFQQANRLVSGPELRGIVKGANKLMNSQEIQETIKGANKLVNSKDIEDSIHNLKESLHSFKSILHKLDKRAEPIAVNLEQAIGAGHHALEKARVTLGLIDEVLKPESPLQFRFNQLTEELAETARSIRALLDMLERNPNSIIFGKKPSGEK
jgi:paraquat-inducible protein B